MKSEVVAIIPARGGSKGIPRKNIRPLNGKPLVAHTIELALKSQHIDRVILNSEDPEIQEVGAQYGAQVQPRPEDYWHDNTFQEVDRLLQWCVTDLEKQGVNVGVVLLLYPTAPLRRLEHIDKSVELILQKGFDSSLTLYEDTTYLWKVVEGIAAPTNYDPKTRGPRQKEAWNQWGENKAVYAMKRDLLMDTGCRLGGKIGMVEMSKLDSIDIDRPEDFQLCEMLLQMREVNA